MGQRAETFMRLSLYLLMLNSRKPDMSLLQLKTERCAPLLQVEPATHWQTSRAGALSTL